MFHAAGHTRGLPVEDLADTVIGARGRPRPFDGQLVLPMLSLSEEALRQNTSALMQYAHEQGAELAPHAKTPMAPDLARQFVAAGAWGATVANVRQAAVMLDAGITNLIIASEIGARTGANNLASLLARHTSAEVCVFVDSTDLVDALASTWMARPGLPALDLLIHVGEKRSGLRSNEVAFGLADHILRFEDVGLRLAGVGLYEGTLASSDENVTAQAIAALMDRGVRVFGHIAAKVAAGRRLIFTAGGSMFFDLVVKHLRASAIEFSRARIVLRPGAIFFHDHGTYRRAAESMDARSGFVLGGRTAAAADIFKPALRVWAEVISVPEIGLLICGLGERDAGEDMGLPIPLAHYRDGAFTGELEQKARVVKLNDQHAYVHVDGDCDVRCGDVVSFGISHPCTTLEKYRFVIGLDEDDRASRFIPTHFG